MFSVKILNNKNIYVGNMFYFISLITILTFKKGRADVALSHWKLELFKDRIKTWHHYVRMTIGRFVDWTQYRYTNIQQFKYEIVKWSEVVLAMRYRRIKLSHPNNDAVRNNITATTGQLIIDSQSNCNYYLIYNINVRLRLNITFFIIYFSIGLQKCDFAALRIYRHGKKNSLFTFCGHHPLFNFYPDFIKVLLRFKTWMNMLFTLNFSFTVIDHCIVYNIPKDYIAGAMPNLIYKTGHGSLVASFFIEVKKISYVVLNFTHNLVFNYVVYDGPGFSVNLIAVNNSTIISSSTFQCIIQILMYSDEVRYVGTFNYISKNFKKDIHIKLTPQTYMLLQLPYIACSDYLCVFHINTEPDHHINVTLNKIDSAGVYNPTCKYGGILG